MPKHLQTLIICLLLQGCGLHFERHWIDSETPEFQQDWDVCKEEFLKTDKYKKIEDCMFDKGWSKKLDWEVVS